MEENVLKRVLPHSDEAEQSVIGSMIMDRDAIVVASEIITGDDFYNKFLIRLFLDGRVTPHTMMLADGVSHGEAVQQREDAFRLGQTYRLLSPLYLKIDCRKNQHFSSCNI